MKLRQMCPVAKNKLVNYSKQQRIVKMAGVSWCLETGGSAINSYGIMENQADKNVLYANKIVSIV